MFATINIPEFDTLNPVEKETVLNKAMQAIKDNLRAFRHTQYIKRPEDDSITAICSVENLV